MVKSSATFFFSLCFKRPAALIVTLVFSTAIFLFLLLHLSLSFNSPFLFSSSSLSFTANDAIVPPRICSHKGFHSPPLTLPPMLSFPLSSIDSSFSSSRPAWRFSFDSFLQTGIDCFDLDVFSVQDGEYFVAHPRDALIYLKYCARENQRETRALLHENTTIESLSSSLIRDLDSSNYIPSLSSFMVWLEESSRSSPQLFVALEPKSSNPPSLDDLRRLARVLLSLSSEHSVNDGLLRHFVLMIYRHEQASVIHDEFPSLLLTLPIRDLDIELAGSTASLVCNASQPLSSRLALFAPYSMLHPSAKLLHSCGAEASSQRDLFQVARNEMKLRVMTWVVDSKIQADRVAARVDFVVSNTPTLILIRP